MGSSWPDVLIPSGKMSLGAWLLSLLDSKCGAVGASVVNMPGAMLGKCVDRAWLEKRGVIVFGVKMRGYLRHYRGGKQVTILNSIGGHFRALSGYPNSYCQMRTAAQTLSIENMTRIGESREEQDRKGGERCGLWFGTMSDDNIVSNGVLAQALTAAKPAHPLRQRRRLPDVES